MPKRSYDEKMEYYMRKMEKLRDKHHNKRRRRHNDSDSVSSLENNQQGSETVTWDLPVPTDNDPQLAPFYDTEVNLPNPCEPQADMLLEPSTSRQDDPTLQPASAPTPAPIEPTLDPEILSALGEATDLGPTWGPEIHNNLCQLWQPLLKKGMVKEIKEKTFKEYLIPSNCTLLQAPKLNIEISAAITEMVRIRDKKVETTQQQLGIGITAISKAMSSLLTNDNKIEAIKMLSDGCRILCDLHHSETQVRIKMITPGLAKPFLNVIQDSERDETLFGVSLPEKIKASKTIEKQGLQIKKTLTPARSNPVVQSQNTITSRPQLQGNWAAPSRYPTSRGGRGGQKRFPIPSRRPAVATSAVTPQTKPSQNRSRVPARQ